VKGVSVKRLRSAIQMIMAHAYLKLAVGVDLLGVEGRLEQNANAMRLLTVVDLNAHIDPARS
jgi:hypothetical protein